VQYQHAPIDVCQDTLAAPLFTSAVAPSAGRLRELDILLSSYKLVDNARVAAREVGLADGDAYITSVLAGESDGNIAVVEAALQAGFGVSAHTTILGSLRSAMASVLSAAVRLGRCSPLASQRIQVRNVGAIVALAAASCDRPVDQISSTAIQFDIAGMRHETRRQRSFAS
jgi:urease accessory protein